jgi:ethanolamine utilization protein EutN
VLIARVIGDLVASEKHSSHEGMKILMVQPLNLDGSDRGDAVIAFDAVDAGIGDRVLLATEGFSAMTSVGRPNSPIDMSVIGVIDQIDLIDGLAMQAPAAVAAEKSDKKSRG